MLLTYMKTQNRVEKLQRDLELQVEELLVVELLLEELEPIYLKKMLNCYKRLIIPDTQLFIIQEIHCVNYFKKDYILAIVHDTKKQKMY